MYEKVMMTTVLAVLAVGVTGCLPEGLMTRESRPVEGSQPPAKGTEAKPGDYFRDPGGDSGAPRGAVAEAELWRDRFLKETEKRQKLEDTRRQMEDKNRELTAANTSLAAERDQCKRELEEASAMMIRLNEDLKAWKKDVLGYRAEMRASHQETVQALARVMKLLGAELPGGAARPPTPAASAAPAAPPAGAQENGHAPKSM